MERVQEAAGCRRVTGGFSAGAKKSLPVIIGMIPSTMAFGILAKTAGLGIWESLFMSAVVFAGASQFAALNMLMIGVSMADILITTALLNARHIMMGSSISQRMERGMNPFEKFALFFFLTDESFSIASLQEAEIVTPGFLWGVQLPIFLTWNALTLCGYIGTAFLPRDLQSSMGIAIYALFLAIIISAGAAAVIGALLFPTGKEARG